MAPNTQGQTNHDELFPNHVSTVADTDPELIEFFDNFAVLRKRIASFETQTAVAASTDFTPGE